MDSTTTIGKFMGIYLFKGVSSYPGQFLESVNAFGVGVCLQPITTNQSSAAAFAVYEIGGGLFTMQWQAQNLWLVWANDVIDNTMLLFPTPWTYPPENVQFQVQLLGVGNDTMQLYLTNASVKYYGAFQNIEYWVDNGTPAGINVVEPCLIWSNIWNNGVATNLQALGAVKVNPGVADLSGGAPTSNYNLTYIYLTGADLSNANLPGANLASAILGNVNFDNAILSGASFGGQDLTTCTFLGANLSGVNLSQANIYSNDFQNSNLAGANLSRLDVRGGNYIDCNLTGANLSNLIATLIEFTGANLNNSVLAGAVLTQANMSQAQLNGANLAGSWLSCVNLTAAVLTGAIFSQAFLDRTIFTGAQMTGTDFSNTDVTTAIFSNPPTFSTTPTQPTKFCNAKLNLSTINLDWSYLDLSNATIVGVQSETNLSNLQAVSSNLTGLNLSSVNLTNANLQSAILTETDLAYATLENANLTGAQLGATGSQGAAVMSYAYMPNAILTNANLYAVDLSYAQFYGGNAIAENTNWEMANLTGANLSGMNLSQATLLGVDLSGANLINCNMRGVMLNPTDPSSGQNKAASLTSASLQGADFTDAQLYGADLSGAAVALAHGVPLFTADASYSSELDEGTIPSGLVTVFTSHDIALTNPTVQVITAGQQWLIAEPPPAPTSEGLGYTGFIIVNQATTLLVYGSQITVVQQGDNGQLQSVTLPCLPTILNETTSQGAATFNADTICPNGANYQANQQAGLSWEAMMMAPAPPQPPSCVPSPTHWCPPPKQG